jgi:hypothetical protein
VSQDYRERVLRDAHRLGVPAVLRVGSTVALCSKVSVTADGRLTGEVRAWTCPSAGMARQTVARAVAESGWKTAQRVTS